LIERHGVEAVQRITKAHIEELVADLLAGGTKTGKGRIRRPWGAIAVNKFHADRCDGAQRQGFVARNAAEHVDPVAVSHRTVDTYTEAEVLTLIKGDRGRPAGAGVGTGAVWSPAR
jgi:integrase